MVENRQSQQIEDDCTSDLQIVNVRSLSSVLNMHLPQDETMADTVLNVKDTSNLMDQPANPHIVDKTESVVNNKAFPTLSVDRACKNAIPISSVSTSSISSNTSKPSVSSSKNALNLAEVPKPTEGVKLKITNLKSKNPSVSSITASNSNKSLPKETVQAKGRIKVKSFKELMGKPSDDLSLSENVTSAILAEETNNPQISGNNISELKISSSFSINETNEQENAEGVVQTLIPCEENDIENKLGQENSYIDQDRAETGEELNDKDNIDTGDSKNIEKLPEGTTAENDQNKESPLKVKVKKEETFENLKEEGETSFDKDDCYICMDCQPLKLLNGLGLTRHCINNPTHFQIHHLADFNKFDLLISKLSKTAIDRYLDRITNERKNKERPIILPSQSSIDSGSSDCWSDSSSVKRRRRKRKIERKRYFESSDTATDDDFSQDKHKSQ